jgi:hypothetical protein
LFFVCAAYSILERTLGQSTNIYLQTQHWRNWLNNVLVSEPLADGMDSRPPYAQCWANRSVSSLPGAWLVNSSNGTVVRFRDRFAFILRFRMYFLLRNNWPRFLPLDWVCPQHGWPR